MGYNNLKHVNVRRTAVFILEQMGVAFSMTPIITMYHLIPGLG